MKKFPKIIDNQRKNLLDSLIEVSSNYDQISIATGYWDLKATALLLPHLKKYKKIRLLIGREPLIPRHQLNEVEPDYPDKDIFEDLQRLKIDSDLTRTAKELKKLVDDKIIEVRVFKKAFLHAKCYIFGNFEAENAIGIIGSSNFTKNGLTTNRELNAGEDDQRVVQFNPKNKNQEHGHLSWFEEVWTDDGCVEWTGKFIELLDNSIHGEHIFSPYEMYIHSLYSIYKDELTTSIKVDEESEKILYGFQLRNAELLLKKLSTGGVAMLADSVGLGKTITAGAVIKKYIENKNIKKPRIEILVPASLASQWQEELADHHGVIAGIDNICISSIHNKNELEKRQEIDKYRPVDLFVIDEAHNLRNQNSKRYTQLIEWIKNNEGCHVLLLTATPINNQLSDFAHQINFASGGSEDLFYVPLPKMDGRQQTIKEHYDAIIDLDREIKREINQGKKLDTKKINTIMRPILQHFMVRSTRIGIEREFGGVPDKDGNLIKFPIAESCADSYVFQNNKDAFDNKDSFGLPIDEMLSKDVESIIENKQLSKHPLDMLDEFSSADTSTLSPIHKAFLLTTFLGLPIYRPTLYQNKFYGKSIDDINDILKDSKKEIKSDVKQQLTMHNMMRILYLKRVESSVYALKKTMEYYSERLVKFEKYLNTDKKIIRVSNLKDYAEMMSEDNLNNETIKNIEEITIEADPKIYDIDQLKKDIEKDKKILLIIGDILKKIVKKDDKVDYFIELLNRFNKEGKKVLVFSYFSDTIKFLEKVIPKNCSYITEKNSGFTSGNTKNNTETLAKRFSPKSKKYTFKPDETELQFLFSTDVLSEGQNLQDCSVLINYDLHWNPVRMIQRNGRINRLGGEHEKVFIHNLCPANEIETYLRLEDRLKKKIELIKASIGTDQSILGEDDNPLEFNDQESLETKLKTYDPNVDLDDLIKQHEAETDILSTEDTFIADLRRFDNIATPEEKERIYYKIPYGKWGVLPKENISDFTPEVLTNTVIKLREGEETQDMAIFVGLPKDGGTISFVDKLEALQTLKANMDTQTPVIDFSKFKKDKIENTLEDNLLQVAEQAIVRPENNIKPSQEIVLESLHRMKIPTQLIERAIKEHRNRHDRKYIVLRLSRLYSDIKEGRNLNQKTLGELLKKAEKINIILDNNLENKLTIDDNPIIYSYHAKP